MPAKKAKFKTHMNQRLSGAIALGAAQAGLQMFLRVAARVLCISQSVLTIFELDKRATRVLTCLQAITASAATQGAGLRMDRSHQRRHVVRRGVLADPVAQVEDVGRPGGR